MKTILKSTLAAAVAATGVFAATGASAEEITIRCQHFVSPKAGVPSRFMQPWADKVMAWCKGSASWRKGSAS